MDLVENEAPSEQLQPLSRRRKAAPVKRRKPATVQFTTSCQATQLGKRWHCFDATGPVKKQKADCLYMKLISPDSSSTEVFRCYASSSASVDVPPRVHDNDHSVGEFLLSSAVAYLTKELTTAVKAYNS